MTIMASTLAGAEVEIQWAIITAAATATTNMRLLEKEVESEEAAAASETICQLLDEVTRGKGMAVGTRIDGGIWGALAAAMDLKERAAIVEKEAGWRPWEVVGGG